MDLTQLRKDIDEIDRQLVELYEQRMDICKRVAEYKIENHKPVLISSVKQRSFRRSVGLPGKRRTGKAWRSCLRS